MLVPNLHPEHARSWETQSIVGPQVCKTDFDPTAVSCGRDDPESPLPVGRKRKACPDIFICQIRKIAHDLFGRHPGGEIFQHIANRDPHPADARLPAPFIRLDCDEVRVIHSERLPLGRATVKLAFCPAFAQ